jgi:hypothetical protein
MTLLEILAGVVLWLLGCVLLSGFMGPPWTRG